MLIIGYKFVTYCRLVAMLWVFGAVEGGVVPPSTALGYYTSDQ